MDVDVNDSQRGQATAPRAWPAWKRSLLRHSRTALDANANPPAQRADASGDYAGVGSVLFNMIANAERRKVYVSNTEAHKLDRFAGPGAFTGHRLREHLHESCIAVLGPAGVAPRYRNNHINKKTAVLPIRILKKRAARRGRWIGQVPRTAQRAMPRPAAPAEAACSRPRRLKATPSCPAAW